MKSLQSLFEQNQKWADSMVAADPNYFAQLLEIQAPKYLWIGCSDSRIPANQVLGLPPGEVFVHRNVANLVIHTDFNCLSVLQFAIEILKIEDVIVCGHYGCSGVRAAMDNRELGLIDNWLHSIKDVYAKHQSKLDRLDDRAREDRLCELNVIEQVHNICQTSIAQQAWRTGQPLRVHGWIYALGTGRLRDLKTTVDSPSDIDDIYRTAGSEG